MGQFCVSGLAGQRSFLYEPVLDPPPRVCMPPAAADSKKAGSHTVMGCFRNAGALLAGYLLEYSLMEVASIRDAFHPNDDAVEHLGIQAMQLALDYFLIDG